MIARQLLEVLSAAHERGIVHRDLKPANLFLTRAGALKVLDFGIARLHDATSQKLTTTGSTLGTPAFMAPEQVLGKTRTAATAATPAAAGSAGSGSGDGAAAETSGASDRGQDEDDDEDDKRGCSYANAGTRHAGWAFLILGLPVLGLARRRRSVPLDRNGRRS